MISDLLAGMPRFDPLSTIMVLLVLVTGLTVGLFSRRYLAGDDQYKPFFVRFTLLIISLCLMVSTNEVWVLWGACVFNLYLLVRLMIHKASWSAALNSGLIAARVFALHACLLGLGFLFFVLETGSSHISVINQSSVQSNFMLLALVFILIAAMMQSAIWPFQRWLISSMNAPTPVSAIMHAGLVNGGGFLLIRFAPLYLQHPVLLECLFAIGLLTATLGTLWKLMQSDVKRMLACSTMGQMGFMFLQCGLGLFPAALAHLMWHAFFKAKLLLQSASVVKETRYDLNHAIRWHEFLFALICGFVGSLVFGALTHKSWLAGDTTLVLLLVAGMVCTQFALPLLKDRPWRGLPLALVLMVAVGGVYGASVEIIAWAMQSMGVMQPQPLHAVHVLGILVLIGFWLLGFYVRSSQDKAHYPAPLLKAYVAALNASQAHSSTITAHRSEYRYE